MKILLAVDGSSYSKKMLAYLVNHEALFAPSHEYHLLTVLLSLPTRAKALLGKDAVADYVKEESNKVLNPVIQFLQKHKIKASSEYKIGHPSALIAQTAEEGRFDLIVMGSHGQSALGNLVMGSVATNVIANCKTPILLVR